MLTLKCAMSWGQWVEKCWLHSSSRGLSSMNDEHEHLYYKGSSKRTEKRELERGTKKKYLCKSLSPVAAWGASALDSVHSELHRRKIPRSLNKVDVSNFPPMHPPASRRIKCPWKMKVPAVCVVFAFHSEHKPPYSPSEHQPTRDPEK